MGGKLFIFNHLQSGSQSGHLLTQECSSAAPQQTLVGPIGSQNNFGSFGAMFCSASDGLGLVGSQIGLPARWILLASSLQESLSG